MLIRRSAKKNPGNARSFMPIILIGLVPGLMYMGVCTAMEAAAIGTFGALVLLIINKRFTWKVLHD